MGFFGYFEKYYINVSFGWNYIFTMVLMTIEISLVMNSFKYDRKGIIFKLLDCLITFVLYLFVFCFAEFFLGSHQYINYLCWPIIIALHFFYFCHYKTFDKISKCLCLTILLYLEPMLSSTIVELFADYSPNFGLVSSILNVIFAISVILFMPKYTLKKTEKINYVCFFLMIFLVAFTLAFIIVDLPEGESFLNAWSHLVIYLLIGTFALISYYYFYCLNLDFTNSLESQALLIKEERNKIILETSQNNLEDLRKRRHDMKNQYQYMRLLLENGDTDKLNEFFQRMIEGREAKINPSKGKETEISYFEDRIRGSFKETNFAFHDNFDAEGLNLLIEVEDLLIEIIKDNLNDENEMDIWMEGNDVSLFLTMSIKEEKRLTKFSKGSLHIDPSIQKSEKGTFLTYRISKTNLTN